MNHEIIRNKLNELKRFEEIEKFILEKDWGSTSFKINMYHTPLFSEITEIFTRKFSLSQEELLSILEIKIDKIEEELESLGIHNA